MSFTVAAAELRENAQQWAAYESKKHCVVLAGPGSGKTKVLTIKLARLLEEDVTYPRGIACVTYNNECVRELRKRMDRLGVPESERIFVGTLHSFCLRHVLRPFAILAGAALPPKLKIGSETDRRRILGEALKQLNISGRLDDFESDLGKFRRDCLDRTAAQGWQPGDRGLTDVCVAYEEGLAREQLLDFDGSVAAALRLVEQHRWVRTCLRATFPILVVDEYQDLGLALHRLVLSLCFDAGMRLLAVGDPDQSIYGFTGAHPELLRQLAGRADVERIELKLNYRSASRIVEASKAALGQERDYRSTSDAVGVIEVHRCQGGVDVQVATLCNSALPDILTRRAAGDVVILYPSRYEGGLVEKAFQAAGIQSVRLGRDTTYARTPLTRLIEDFARWCAGGWKEGDPKLSRLTRRWASLQGALDPDLGRQERLKVVRFLFSHRTDQAAAFQWLSDFQAQVLALGDCRTRLMATGDLDSFDLLLVAASPGHPMAAFTVKNLAGQAGSPDHVNLLTLHSSKGSEFGAVVIVGVDQGCIPRHGAGTADEIAEARRLFYVGISRAREEVHLLHSIRIAGDRYRQGPSIFIADVVGAGG